MKLPKLPNPAKAKSAKATAAKATAAKPESTALAAPELSPEDAALWRSVAGTTAPLPGREVRLPRAMGSGSGSTIGGPAEEPKTGGDETAPGARRPVAEQARPAAKPALPPLESAAAGATPGVDKRTATRLRRGQLHIDARLDLHGMTQEEGCEAFSLFVQNSGESGARCVLVITGKGIRPDGSVGVLRAALPHWLNQPELRPSILAFAPAQPRDGGDGAVYILLRRRR